MARLRRCSNCKDRTSTRSNDCGNLIRSKRDMPIGCKLGNWKVGRNKKIVLRENLIVVRRD